MRPSKKEKRSGGQTSGTFTKDLLLMDKKDRLFLLSVHEDRALDLKTLHTKLGSNGRMGFASSERVRDHLGVLPSPDRYLEP